MELKKVVKFTARNDKQMNAESNAINSNIVLNGIISIVFISFAILVELAVFAIPWMGIAIAIGTLLGPVRLYIILACTGRDNNSITLENLERGGGGIAVDLQKQETWILLRHMQPTYAYVSLIPAIASVKE